MKSNVELSLEIMRLVKILRSEATCPGDVSMNLPKEDFCHSSVTFQPPSDLAQQFVLRIARLLKVNWVVLLLFDAKHVD